MVKLQTFVSTYHPSSSVFMTNNMCSGAKKHPKGTKPESHQTAKMFLFPKAKYFLPKGQNMHFFFFFFISFLLFIRMRTKWSHANQ